MYLRNLKFFAVLIVTALVFSSCNLLPTTDDTTDENQTHTSTTKTGNETKDDTTSESSLAALPGFDSCSAFEKKVDEYTKAQNDEEAQYWGAMEKSTGMTTMDAEDGSEAATMPMVESGGSGAEEYSTTNVQVEGVDEPDIVKNDGEYIYTVSGERIEIIKAFPPEDAKLLATIDYAQDEDNNAISQYVLNIFLYKDSLVVFGNRYYSIPPRFIDRVKSALAPYGSYYPSYDYHDVTFIDLYDISDHKKPELKRSVEYEGYYNDARMIEDKVYFVLNQEFDYYHWDESKKYIPQYRDSLNTDVGVAIDTFEDIVSCDTVKYMEPFDPNSFIIIGAFDADDYEGDFNKEVIMGSAENIYASQNNLYIAQTNYRNWWEGETTIPVILEEDTDLDVTEAMPPELNPMIQIVDDENITNKADVEESAEVEATDDEKQPTNTEKAGSGGSDTKDENSEDIKAETEKVENFPEITSIYKFSLHNGKVNFEAEGKVPGHVLNQYSMDEFENHFRVATTVRHVSRVDSTTENNIIILDEDLGIVGEITHIAPGEDIYSARFMGKKGYLVTFKKIDPFFVIDLADPTNPKVLGKLKIPGYSDYLHPYDENHIIGIGKDTEAAEEKAGDFAWYQGIKIAIFDVTDVEDPKEMHKIVIGDRGTDSPILGDPKAFLFDKEKELMVIPITIAEIDKKLKNDPLTDRWTYGDTVFQGALVYKVNLEDGFKEIGRITHLEDEESYSESGYYFYSYGTEIQRSLYIDNILYTISTGFIKANDLDNDLSEEAVIDLKYEYPEYPYGEEEYYD